MPVIKVYAAIFTVNVARPLSMPMSVETLHAHLAEAFPDAEIDIDDLALPRTVFASPCSAVAARPGQLPGETGGVRRNAGDRAESAAALSAEHDAPPRQGSAKGPRRTAMSLVDMEREHLIEILRLTDGNKSRAAVILGIERSTLDRKLKRYEIEAGEYRG